MSSLHWQESFTPEKPYYPRRETCPEAVHSSAEWEGQRNKILELRKTMGLKQIIAHMNAEGFVASEAQYKYHLKKWREGKYVKLTENQLGHIVQKVRGRQLEGKKAAVRLNGEKLPSKNAERIFQNKKEILGKYVEAAEEIAFSKAIEGHDSSKEGLEEGEQEDEETRLPLSEDAPTIIDSMRITVYTSSTLRGIRNVFPRRKRNKLPDSGELPLKASWETVIRRIFDSSSWGPHGSVIDFDPRCELYRGRIKLHFPHLRMQHIFETGKSSTREQFSRNSKKFLDFLVSNNGDHQLYRREIDPLNCPQNIWAVDMGPWFGKVPTGIEADMLMIPGFSRAMYADVKRGFTHRYGSFEDYGMYCIAWCIREASEWNEWIEKAGNLFPDGDTFICGHDMSALRQDGPVIFTTTLERKCWEQGGCQANRMDSSGDTNYMPWSATKTCTCLNFLESVGKKCTCRTVTDSFVQVHHIGVAK